MTIPANAKAVIPSEAPAPYAGAQSRDYGVISVLPQRREILSRFAPSCHVASLCYLFPLLYVLCASVGNPSFSCSWHHG